MRSAFGAGEYYRIKVLGLTPQAGLKDAFGVEKCAARDGAQAGLKNVLIVQER